MPCHSLLACRDSSEKSAVNLMGVPLHVICHFSLVAFNNFSLSLIFVSLITMFLGVFLLGFILPGTRDLLDLGGYFLAAFNIFSLYLIFDSSINMCLGVFLLGFILYGTLCASWT